MFGPRLGEKKRCIFWIHSSNRAIIPCKKIYSKKAFDSSDSMDTLMVAHTDDEYFKNTRDKG